MKTCPNCGGMMESEEDWLRFRNQVYRWLNYYCTCGYEEDNEPDWEDHA